MQGIYITLLFLLSLIPPLFLAIALYSNRRAARIKAQFDVEAVKQRHEERWFPWRGALRGAEPRLRTPPVPPPVPSTGPVSGVRRQQRWEKEDWEDWEAQQEAERQVDNPYGGETYSPDLRFAVGDGEEDSEEMRNPYGTPVNMPPAPPRSAVTAAPKMRERKARFVEMMHDESQFREVRL